MAMQFLGKWSLAQGASYVQVDMGSGELKVGAKPADGSERFNVYGTGQAFIIQAANGKYVVASGDGYAANHDLDSSLNQFAIAKTAAGVRLTDLGADGGGATKYFLAIDNGQLTRVATGDDPPATTEFSRTIVTNSLADILSQGFGSVTPDLTWVNISGTDFSQAPGTIDFTQSVLTNADLSACKFEPNTGFDGSSGQQVNFSQAVLSECSMGSCDFSAANFSDANLQGIEAAKTKFSKAVMRNANFCNAENLAKSDFIGADLSGANFSGTGNIYHTDFTDADLTGVIFTGSSVTGPMTLNGANLTNAALNNPDGEITIYPNSIELDSTTNFTGCKLQYIDFSGYKLGQVVFTRANLAHCNLNGADLTMTELSYATLDGAALTGTISLHGANLSNASLRDADLTNAQMGALSKQFTVQSGTPSYDSFLKALQTDDVDEVQKVFGANGYPLQGTVTITSSKFDASTWTVSATAPSPVSYTVVQEKVGNVDALNVYTPTTPAVLVNAFMVNVNLTGANLIGVTASGASIYGDNTRTKLNAALLQGAQLNNANLSNADFSSANLAGVNFDYSILINAVFQNSKLIVNAGGTRCSFNGANLQGASFDGATLNSVVFSNAAVGVENPLDGGQFAGVWLFSLDEAQTELIQPELEASSPTQPPSKPRHQFTIDMQSLQQLQSPGPVGAGIVKQFSLAGVTLTRDAVLTIVNNGIYWQISDGSTSYVVFESFDADNYVPALGVAKGTSYTPTAEFYVPLSLESSLRNGLVEKPVVEAFDKAGHAIQDSSTVTVAQHPTEWQVVNGAPDYTVYTIWLDHSAGATQLSVRPSISNLIAAFGERSVAISRRATVVQQDGGYWQLSNDSENPFNPVTGYIIYTILPNATTSGLDVYGHNLRIVRLKSPTEAEYQNIPAALTNITQGQMSSPGVISPNGEFSSTNQTNHLPFQQWMWARMPPAPPRCVPDPAGMYYCPT